MIIETVILSGAAVAGAQAMRRDKGLDRFIAMQRQLKSRWAGWTASPRVDVPEAEVRRADRFLVLSAASLGMTVAGLVLTQPWLSLTGIPPALVVFVPTFRRAYKTLRHKRRIDNHVLDATRVDLHLLNCFIYSTFS